MPIRTTADLVKGVLLQDYDAKRAPALDPFIAGASSMVDQVQSLAIGRSMLTLTAATLELVERWLAAHFYCQTDKTYQSKNQGGASASFSGQTAMGLDSTMYGQTAKRIDWTGFLTALDKRQVAGAIWLGKRPSEEIPYDQRS